MTLVDILNAISGVLFAASAGLVLIRIVRGPSIIDRMVGSDVLVTLVLLALIADMVVNHHTRSIPLLLALSGTAVFGSIAVARYVSKHDRSSDDEQRSLEAHPRGKD
jgi:multicomponent Na+:H+ antiporter subunit F